MTRLSFFFKGRHFSTLQLHPLIIKNYGNPLSEDTQIIHLCRAGSLWEAVKILNATDPSKIGVKPLVYASLIQTSTKVQSFVHGLQFHAHAVKSGLETDRFVGNSLLALYFKLGCDFAETRKFFDGLVYRDVISWTSMITGYIRVGKPLKAVEVFMEMLGFDIQPNAYTLSGVIKACAELEALGLGKCFHGVVVKYGFGSNHVISSALIDMYGRNNESLDARFMFDEMLEPDAISWTCVISAFVRNDIYEQALRLFYSMQRDCGLRPDTFTFGPVLTACGNLGRLKQGKQMHAKAITSGICENVVVESSLVDMYAKCGFVDKSRRVFDGMKEKNSVSWSALLGGYCQNGDFKSVIDLSRVMDVVDLYSFGTILRACAGLTALCQGKEVHCQYVRIGNQTDVIIESALVDLYAKCGRIEQARTIFGQMTAKNTITWNSMICGYAQNGRAEESLQMFNKMIEEGVQPNNISFVGVLFACCHTGLLEQGREHFWTMTAKYGIRPEVQHYNCMIDLLGRDGLLEEAERLLMGSEYKDDSSLWAVLLGACTTCTNSAAAVRIAERMMELDPAYHLSYVYLANCYKATGQFVKASTVINLMKQRRINKLRGLSWVETDQSSLDRRLNSNLIMVD
uniref:Pentatricopeptide repeat-containing protein n=1 Tax=Kalanchoe fedtschenkoi TaxID=63787 RepID=A0A7N0UKR3_KALFE